MWNRIKWGLIAAAAVIAALFLLYFMPSYDVVRIVGTEVARRDSQQTEPQQSNDPAFGDVRFIKATTADDEPVIYRNEDTGWGWPPYFKFDSADLAARADALAVEAANATEGEGWSVVTHYGWRIEMLRMFPNAVNIRPATGPDEWVVPWANIVILVALAAAVWWASRFVRRVATRVAG